MSKFLERIKSFAVQLTNYIQSGGQLVDQNTANTRAEICLQCHNHKIEKEFKRACCGGGVIESAVIISVRTAIVGQRKTTSDKKLGTCGICGCDLKLKVWFPSDPLGVTEENKNKYPSFCPFKQIVNFNEKDKSNS